MFNRYAYVFNNPLRYVDPLGLFTEDQLRMWLGQDWLDTWRGTDWYWHLIAADFGTGSMIAYRPGQLVKEGTFELGFDGTYYRLMLRVGEELWDVERFRSQTEGWYVRKWNSTVPDKTLQNIAAGLANFVKSGVTALGESEHQAIAGQTAATVSGLRMMADALRVSSGGLEAAGPYSAAIPYSAKAQILIMTLAMAGLLISAPEAAIILGSIALAINLGPGATNLLANFFDYLADTLER